MSDREELASTIDPAAFDESIKRSTHHAAVLQWAARRHIALEHADRVLASDWLARHDAAIGERIALAIEAEASARFDPRVAVTDAWHYGFHDGAVDAARIARTTETVTYDGFGAPIVEEGL